MMPQYGEQGCSSERPDSDSGTLGGASLSSVVRRHNMFRTLSKLFRQQPAPKEPFVDGVLGEFAFDRELGWKKQMVLAGSEAELVLGSDGEAPSDEMLLTARSWVEQWSSQHPKIIEYIRREFRGRSDKPGIPVPDKFEVESINVLWRDKPKACMIYFHYPGDDIRAWHVTFEGFEPTGMGVDD
jgi:hypothetical protein